MHPLQSLNYALDSYLNYRIMHAIISQTKNVIKEIS